MENGEIIILFFTFFNILYYCWIIEVIVVGTREKKFVNRGFMMGPYCPIYGYSSIIMVFYLDQYRDNILTVFLLAVIVCSFIEYVVSYIMEKLFSARWWDYSNRKFNINGRVCITNAFFFGILGAFLVYIVNPFINDILLTINTTTLNIVSSILLTIFIIDFIVSIGITYKLKNTIKKFNKDNTEEITRKIKETIENRVLNRRIFKAFPNFKTNILTKFNILKEDIREKRNNKQ